MFFFLKIVFNSYVVFGWGDWNGMNEIKGN